MKKISKIVSLELIIWTTGLLFLALYPFGTEHITVCPLKNLGLSFCPGCGLGMSLHHLFYLDFESSFSSHPLGFFAFAVILIRILTLVKNSYTQYSFLYKRNHNGQCISVNAKS